MDPAELLKLAEKHLAGVQFPENPSGLYDPIRYTLSLGGKRLRPVLVFAGAELAGANPECAVNQAIGIELFHNFTLIHDDVMDEAPLRRNKPTVVAKWNVATAILSGDVLFSEACRYISKANPEILPQVLEVFFDTASGVCEGQQYDMAFEVEDSVTLDDYLGMIRLKTAILLGASLQLGALCGGADTSTARKLFEAGTLFGIAFQIQDDFLDVFGDSALFGKQAGGDILSGKKTCLKLIAMDRADASKRAELMGWYQNQDADPREKVQAVSSIFRELKVDEEVKKLAYRYFEEGNQIISGLGIKEELLVPFRKFALSFMERTV